MFGKSSARRSARGLGRPDLKTPRTTQDVAGNKYLHFCLCQKLCNYTEISKGAVMPLKKDSIFYDIFNLEYPWEIIIISLSKSRLNIDFKLDYNSDTLTCPICNRQAHVIGKTSCTWRHLDLLEYSTRITAYVPSVESRNPSCKACYDQTTLSNLLLLDLIVKQLKNTAVMKPLHCLFEAMNSDCVQQTHSADRIAATFCHP